jgi:hypothetical protein
MIVPGNYARLIAARRGKDAQSLAANYWETIACNLKKRGRSLGYVSTLDSQGRTIWISDAHRGDGKRLVVRADEKLTAWNGISRISDRTN